MSDGTEMTSTYVSIRGPGDWPFTECGYVLHRRDLTDLGEPYLSAVREARAVRDANKNAAGNEPAARNSLVMKNP